MVSRKLSFWILLCSISASGVVFAVRYFGEAFPIVTLNLRMDRSAALEAARGLATRRAWGPQGYSQAASFDLDSSVQDYVELQVGGSNAFRQVLQQHLYSPYRWRVRHFREGEPNETLIEFTPEGEPYGFQERLREDAIGAALSAEAARSLAQRVAQDEWAIQFSDYVLAESSQEKRPGGRIDHTFVFERSDRKLGEGLYRLRLVVGGDRLTELTHFIKIPEAFERRYEEMRSANNTIATIASFGMLMLYLLGGCIAGLFFLLRSRAVIWKKPLLWASSIAFLNFLTNICEVPLNWMGYDTALSAREFLVQQLLVAAGEFLLWVLLLTITFIAAEGLTRRAFPQMIQHWKLWSPRIASSKEVLGRTIGGYLVVGFDMAFVVAVYFLMTRHFGWWTPSDVLFEPNVLATYLPWLTPIARSLQAGFWEECMFRAIPLSAAALLGERFGLRKTFLVAAFLLQALIFGAGHANYPSQPAYARLVELIIPSFVFGGIYLSFGLLPSIISHFVFDVIWFSIPLFVSSAHGLWVDQALVIFFSLCPVWVIVWARTKTGSWSSLRDEDYNRAWHEQKRVVSPERLSSGGTKAPEVTVIGWPWLTVAGVAGLATWIVCTPFHQDAVALSVKREAAVQLACQVLQRQGFNLSADWTILPSIEGEAEEDDRFVWQKGGKQAYHRLLDRYVHSPGWNIRFARFKGEVVERTEEFDVSIFGSGEIARIRHQLPESVAGATLSQPEARELAYEAIRRRFKQDVGSLNEISATASKHPHRVDWTFVFSTLRDYPLTEGQARITAVIGGDQVTDAYRHIWVPEEWLRQERSHQSILKLIHLACLGLLSLILGVAAAIAVVHWSRHDFSLVAFKSFFLLILGTQIILRWNNWPAIKADFSTSEPLSNQVMVAIAANLVGAFVQALLIGVLFGFFRERMTTGRNFGLGRSWIAAGFAAFLVVGVTSFASRFAEPDLSPNFAEYGAAGTNWPWLSALGIVWSWSLGSALMIIMSSVFEVVSQSLQRYRIVVVMISILVGIALAGVSPFGTIRYWLISGVLFGGLVAALYFLVIRPFPSSVPIAVGAVLILETVSQMYYRAFPSAVPSGLLKILAVILLMVWFQSKSFRRGPRNLVSPNQHNEKDAQLDTALDF